jgi:RNA polymerase sigma-70 factor (ECF subfamily)
MGRPRVSAHLRLVTPPFLAPAPARPAEPTAAQRLEDLRARNPEAERWLLETYAARVERILTSILGHATGIEDGVQEVFVRVFARVGEIRDANAIQGFVTSVAVFVARETIRTRRRHRWLRFLASEDLPEPPTSTDPESREALRAFYRTIGEMETDERLCFTLRYVDGMDLAQVAEACGFSLATAKRRLKRAEVTFVERCRNDEALRPWLEAGSRWA